MHANGGNEFSVHCDVILHVASCVAVISTQNLVFFSFPEMGLNGRITGAASLDSTNHQPDVSGQVSCEVLNYDGGVSSEVCHKFLCLPALSRSTRLSGCAGRKAICSPGPWFQCTMRARLVFLLAAFHEPSKLAHAHASQHAALAREMKLGSPVEGYSAPPQQK